MAKKKQTSSVPDPEYIATRRASLRRVHRQVIYLNDKEMAALKEYCDRFGIKERSSIFREATMERILAQLDDFTSDLVLICCQRPVRREPLSWLP